MYTVQERNGVENNMDMKAVVFKLNLSIYSVAECGEDLSSGKPFKVSVEGYDPYELKKKIEGLIIDTMLKCEAKSGVCYVQMEITNTHEDKYFDSDEKWITVDLENKKIIYGIAKHTIKFKFILKSGVTFDAVGTMDSEAYEKVKSIIKESFTNDHLGTIEFPCGVVRLSDCSVVDWDIMKTEVEEVI